LARLSSVLLLLVVVVVLLQLRDEQTGLNCTTSLQ
jgi:hypothetical protein